MELKEGNSSKRSILPHWDGSIYSRYASSSYDLVTNLTGWRKKLVRYALSGLEPCRVLDVGCGTGYLMNLASQSGFDVTGLDPSEGMLKQASLNYGFKDEKLHAAPADNMPFANGEFDMVIASGSLVHVPDIELAVSEINRVVKGDGLIRVIDHAVPFERNLLTPLVYLFSQASGDILHDYEHYFSKYSKLIQRKTIGRGGYMQLFDFQKNG